MKRNRLIRYLMVVIAALGLVAMAFVATAGAVADVTAPAVTSVVPADGSTIFTNGTSTVYYQAGNATPLVIKADYADEAGGSGVNPESVMVHLDVANMLMNCPVQTETHVECVATAADLFPGTHPVDVYVEDYSGNLNIHRTWVTVIVDDTAPSYSNLTPADGSIIYTSQLNSSSTNDMSALRIDYDLSDPDPSSGYSPMTHINESVPPGVAGAMISNSSCVKTPSATNPAHYSCQMNRANLLHLGDNTLSILLKDKVGNSSSDYSNPANLKHYTVIDDVAPAVSDVTADASAISASYNDPLPTGASSTQLASGIAAGTAMIHVDGAMIMDGCTATETGITCPTPAGLAPGAHDIEVTVNDNAGNPGLGAGTLTIDPPPCSAGKPSLSLRLNGAYWASLADYQARLLSVPLRLTNSGATAAVNVQFTSSTPGAGAHLMTAMPRAVGDMAPGGTADVVLVFHVMEGTGSFRITNTASADDECGNPYLYP